MRIKSKIKSKSKIPGFRYLNFICRHDVRPDIREVSSREGYCFCVNGIRVSAPSLI